MDNFRIRDFEDKVINLFNSSDLQIEIKRLVAQNVLNLLTKKADELILQELREGQTEQIYMKEVEKNAVCKDSICE